MGLSYEWNPRIRESEGAPRVQSATQCRTQNQSRSDRGWSSFLLKVSKCWRTHHFSREIMDPIVILLSQLRNSKGSSPKASQLPDCFRLQIEVSPIPASKILLHPPSFILHPPSKSGILSVESIITCLTLWDE